MNLIDGKRVAAELTAKVRAECERMTAAIGKPGLTVVIVGEDPASKIYVRKKIQTCQDNGFESRLIELPADASQEDLLARIDELNADGTVDGILVQMPLPGHIDGQAVIDRIDPGKDVDGFHPVNSGRLMSGMDSLWPCTPHGCLDLLDHYGVEIAGADAVVVGRSNIVGKPMALMLINRRATVTVCTSKTRNLDKVCARADILVAAVGAPRMVGADMVRKGAVVIDVGINRVDGRIIGDVDFDAVAPKASLITPVPGGVGPMTIAKLLENTLKAAKRRRGA
jgi:methylenetetrahydrofolate dehydrogenase (NADP+)/methenyltetrahydrofolate cyclohydrolase